MDAAVDIKTKVDIDDLSFFYGATKALKNVSVPLHDRKVTAFIGPSGCGKSTLLRAINRIYELYPNQHAEGAIVLDGENVLEVKDLNLLRARIGMVFQKPTPFPMSIYDNVAFGIKSCMSGCRVRKMEGRVEDALTRAALWGESEGQALPVRPVAVRRPAAALVHRPHRGDAAGSDFAGRALFGARSYLDRQDRGID